MLGRIELEMALILPSLRDLKEVRRQAVFVARTRYKRTLIMATPDLRLGGRPWQHHLVTLVVDSRVLNAALVEVRRPLGVPLAPCPLLPFLVPILTFHFLTLYRQRFIRIPSFFCL